jgi:hypothetical protein
MRYILIHSEPNRDPVFVEKFGYWARAAIINHRLSLSEIELTDKQKVALAKYSNPPAKISVTEIQADNDDIALFISNTVSGGGPMELFQV